jgi:hypothetical protein
MKECYVVVYENNNNNNNKNKQTNKETNKNRVQTSELFHFHYG